MNLTQLRYAKAVAETGSFTLAAERCYVTQPTLSNGIAQLEQELEERLFTRTTRSVSLTPFGRQILPFIDKVLLAQDELLRQTRKHARPSRKTVRIGTSPLLRSSWLSPMLERFRAERPDIEIILHEQNMADLYRMLDDGLLDFVFGVADTKKPSWTSVFLYSEPLRFIPRGPTAPESAAGRVRFQAVAGETFVMVPNVCGLAKATRALFRSHRKKLNEYGGEALSYQVLEEWAGLGFGAAILPESKLRSSTGLVLTDAKGKAHTLEFEAVCLADRQRADHLRDFSRFLAQYQEERPLASPAPGSDSGPDTRPAPAR